MVLVINEVEVLDVTVEELIAILEAESLRADRDYQAKMAEIEMGLYEACVRRGGIN